jgi:TRAP-type C4-dicarboxylate transport system substrate-binding protein
MSERFWKKLTSDDQHLILSCVQESSRWQLNYMKKLDIELEQKLKERGMQFTYPDRDLFRHACEPAYKAIYQKLGPGAADIVKRIRDTE